jgi:hypothetical protein
MRCVGSQVNYAGPIREAEELATKIRDNINREFGNNLQKGDLD